jgi:hypothetical protein
MALQNKLARAAESRGFQPLSPSASDCLFDVAWRDGKTMTLVEVKTLSTTNEAAQIRLAVGQILDYADLLRSRGVSSVRCAICVPHAVLSRRYVALCQTLGITLAWPPNYRGIW